MNFFQIIYAIGIKPLQILFEYIYSVAMKGLGHPGVSIIALSLAMNILVLPLYKRADEVQDKERDTENKLRKGVNHIKKVFKGDERMMILQTYYRQNNYRPTDVFKSSVSLLLEIPFFIAAYRFLSELPVLRGVSFGPISDLGVADSLLSIGSFSINLLPFLMTVINLISCIIFTKGYPAKTKIQLYGMAIFFFFFLYHSPSGLLIYWTLNNIFSLVKTIYYKSTSIRKILNISFAVLGTLVLFMIIPIMKVTGSKSKSFALLLIVFSLICFIPLILSIIRLKFTAKKEYRLLSKIKSSKALFFICGAFLSFFVGFLIPSQLLKSSPQEFVDIYKFNNPIWFVISSLCIAIGLFIVWGGVFYSLAKEEIKKLFNIVYFCLSFIFTVDYMVFGKNMVILNSALAYTEEFAFPTKTIILNISAVILAVLISVLIYFFLDKWIIYPFTAISLLVLIMSIYNCKYIANDIKALKESVEFNSQTGIPSFTFSKKGKNVVVFMLDRGMGEYIPYFINEKPEIKEMYDGFCYYPNTVSYGLCTNYCAPALFGGYEYTPEEMNLRDNELLVDKHNESLKVLPVLFDNSGYNVTVCDPPYAGYQFVPDLSIYEDYPNINTYITKGYFLENKYEGVSDRNYRNFFCYSLMKVSPLILQKHLYAMGSYNEILPDDSDKDVEPTYQWKKNLYEGYSIAKELMFDYTTLIHLSDITRIVDDDSCNFLMIDNEMTHDAYYFQEGEYEVSTRINNYDYEMAHSDRYEYDGIKLEMSNEVHYSHYQTNMAAILKIGAWLDYLKKEGVYDNTRIIIVSDHGRWVHHNELYAINSDKDDLLDLESYWPLLMIKDFDSHGFTISDDFMTNADVPTYAVKDIISNPVNPFTGKIINNEEKFLHPQKILGCYEENIYINNGTKFMENGVWLSVEKDMRDKDNWSILIDNR